MIQDTVIIRLLDPQDYLSCWQAMQEFTNNRDENSTDEIWLLEHLPVFTQGQNGKPEHLLNPGNIPVIQTDRGGQITYHGPGQIVAYTLIDLKRKKINVRQIVTILEQSIIQLLEKYKIHAAAQPQAPGVYVNHKKIASVGLRIRRGCSFHGLAFNVNMDLEPFTRINPCGYAELEITQLAAFEKSPNIQQIGQQLLGYLTKNLGYNTCLTKTELPYATK